MLKYERNKNAVYVRTYNTVIRTLWLQGGHHWKQWHECVTGFFFFCNPGYDQTHDKAKKMLWTKSSGFDLVCLVAMNFDNFFQFFLYTHLSNLIPPWDEITNYWEVSDCCGLKVGMWFLKYSVIPTGSLCCQSSNSKYVLELSTYCKFHNPGGTVPLFCLRSLSHWTLGIIKNLATFPQQESVSRTLSWKSVLQSVPQTSRLLSQSELFQCCLACVCVNSLYIINSRCLFFSTIEW